jgi:hypothetical protein
VGGNAFDDFDVDAGVVGAGVAITHDGSAPDAITGDIGLSQAEVVVATTWADLLEVAVDCAGRTSTAQAQADADHVVRLDLPLYQMVPCEFTSFRLRDGDHWSDGQPVEYLDLGTGFDVGPVEMPVPQADLEAAIAQLEGGSATPVDPDQALRDFVDQLTTSLTTGDRAFAVEHLHPTVVGAFDPGVCAAKVEGIDDDTFAIQITAIGAPASYVYAPPSLSGTQYTVPNVITVSGNITAEGQTSAGELHIADSGDGSFTWFTDCGS